MSQMHTGSCLCGSVRFSVTGPATSTANCHCRMCQKATGAAFATWSEFPQSQVTWLGERPQFHASSEHAKRGFCPNCGSTVTFQFNGTEGVNFATVLFDDPNIFSPTFDIWIESRPHWSVLDERLTHHRKGPR